jgi:hypothetical protein
MEIKRWRMAAAVAVGLFSAASADAAVYLVQISGTISETQGDASAGDIVVGDAVTGSFLVDTSAPILEATLPLGGGTTTVYSVPLNDYSLQVGAYVVQTAVNAATLYYQDDVFGTDGFGFALDGQPGGVFASTFSNVQFQARGASGLLNSSGLGNGLPFNQSSNSFFGSFSNGVDAVRVYGGLNVTVSEQSQLPEPSTWVMLFIGFGAAGAALRRWRHKGKARTGASA